MVWKLRGGKKRRADYFACETASLRGRRYSWRVGILALPTYTAVIFFYNRSSLAGTQRFSTEVARIYQAECSDLSDGQTRQTLLTKIWPTHALRALARRPPSISIWAASSEDRQGWRIPSDKVRSVVTFCLFWFSYWAMLCENACSLRGDIWFNHHNFST